MRKFFIFLTIPLILAACAGAPSEQNASPKDKETPITMTTAEQTASPKAGEQIAVIMTNKGTMKMKFFSAFAPETTRNFIELAKKGFFNKLIFHRVIPDFMIQGGDPLGTGLGGESYKGKNTTLPGEVSSKLSHIYGAVSMANKGGDPDTASSQFFIVQNHDGTKFLDGGYTIFGQVFEGFDVIDTISAVDRDSNDKPKKPVVMEKVEIVSYEVPTN